jgi:prophage antirepressor-like protein
MNNQLIPFDFESHHIRAVIADGIPWFVGRDVCNVLEIKNVSQALQTKRIDSNGREYLNFPENEKADISLIYISSSGTRQTRKTLCVNEPGFYRLIFQSHKPEAERLKTRVFNEVLPQIRKTGKYSTAETRLEAVEAKVDLLLEEKDDRDKLDRCEQSKRRATPKDREEIRRLYKAGYTKADISRITYRGRIAINNALRETESASQPELFEGNAMIAAARGKGGTV